MNKRKKTTAIVAGVTAVALLLGGTFAWVSISQQAKNEAAGIVNVGGRLHDDFNGTNKDVYVENFTDPYNGGQPIYARIKLTEYMEVGSEAGKLNDDGTAYDADRKAASVIESATIDNPESWSIHVPVENCAECYENGTLCKFHEHWRWEMGGYTTFMPTFNKDKDSLEADINGTYAGTDPADKIYYDDYVEYTTDETDTEKTYSKTDTAYYDNDPDMDVNEVDGQYTTKTETHTAKETVNATVMTMAQWKAAGSLPGNYWVYDTDGWAYWANPIMPGEATGLLLSNIEMYKNPGEKCYYSINVVGQFATVNDWEKFGADEEDPDYPSDDALEVLGNASQNVPTVTVVNVSGKTLVNRSEEVTFSATTSVGVATAAVDTDTYEWVVLNEDLTRSTTSAIVDNGDGTATLTVGGGEMSAGLYVAARSKAYGAVGTSAVAVQLYTVTIEGDTTVNANKTEQFSATVADSNTGEAETSGVTWSVFGGNGASTINEETGLLTVDTAEADGAALTVRATSVNGGFIGTHTVTVVNKYAVTVSADSDYIDRGDSLEFSAVVTQNGEVVTPDVIWTVTGGSATTSIDKDGVLTVDVYEQEEATLTVTAISKADGTASGSYTVAVNKYEVSVTADGATTVEAGKTLQFNAAVTKNGETDTSGVYWAVSSNTRTTAMTEDGLLTVAPTVGNGTPLTVTATSKVDVNVSTTYTVTVTAEYELKITSNATRVEPGESLQYDATVLVNGIVLDEDPTVTWSVTDSLGNAVSNASIDGGGTLTADADEYGTSELYVHAEHADTKTTSLAEAKIAYILTVRSTGTFTFDGLRVNVEQSYYSADDITAVFDNNTGATRYNYTVHEDSGGVYLMITHDDVYYAYADHGMRMLTITATGGEMRLFHFACNSHANNIYTPTAYEYGETIFEHHKNVANYYSMTLMNGSTKVDRQYVKWEVTANSKAPDTKIETMNSKDYLCLEAREHSPFVTIYYRTENAWGMKDFRIHYEHSTSVMDEVKNLKLNFVPRDWSSSWNLCNNPETTVTHGMNDANEVLGYAGHTFHYRLYDENNTIIEKPLNLSIWIGDTNITGADDGLCTNGYNASTSVYNDDHGYHWFWVPMDNTTKVTFWISYVNNAGEVGTFEATIW